MRRHLSKKEYKQAKQAAVTLQSLVRQRHARKGVCLWLYLYVFCVCSRLFVCVARNGYAGC